MTLEEYQKTWLYADYVRMNQWQRARYWWWSMRQPGRGVRVFCIHLNLLPFSLVGVRLRHEPGVRLL